MTTALPRVYNVAAGSNFLDVLADALLVGLPFGPQATHLSDWTILLPTRRAAYALSQILKQKSGKAALILPRIKPIGDLDEQGADEAVPLSPIPKAMSATATLMELTNLAKVWAETNHHLPFAAEILASPLQLLNLAKSLQDFITTVETQEIQIDHLAGLYESELAEHREAIIGLLELVTKQLPIVQLRDGLLGPAARRALLIRQEAKRIAESPLRGPIIAAGSTGTIPATRALLQAIACHEQGAVIVPGLDLSLSEASWNALPQEHPQIALKQLIETLGLKRSEINMLGPNATARSHLSSEMLRPSETVNTWHEDLPPQQQHLQQGLEGLSEIACPDRHSEARVIALIMRETLEHKNKTASLVTPDRDLAKRVSFELARWNITVADSAGTSLAQSKFGSLVTLFIKAWQQAFAPLPLLALLRHSDLRLGLDQAAYIKVLNQFEVTVLRAQSLGAYRFSDLLGQAKVIHQTEGHMHPLVAKLTTEDWLKLEEFAATLDVHFGQAPRPRALNIASFVINLQEQLTAIVAPECWARPDTQAVLDVLESVKDESWRWPKPEPFEIALLFSEAITQAAAPRESLTHPRLSILGTLEARLLPVDVLILGGLNETVWPAQPDPGPWLNRTMRSQLGLPQPEKDIGLAAHDFEQGFAHQNVFLTWSKRLGQAPAAPSRWLLRLQAVCDVAGIKADEAPADYWLGLAAALQQPEQDMRFGPIAKPQFAPPLDARPRSFSVTEVEKLIRNPYAIYARKILRLEPMPDLGQNVDAALRGTLFHKALGLWNQVQAPDYDTLIEIGKNVFAPFLYEAEVQHFWWPHFKRMARFIVNQEVELAQTRGSVHAEMSGALTFDLDGAAYSLRARADRIDILHNGEARIIDYKSGAPPSQKQVELGLNPQLTLEAAILLHGGFKPLVPKSVAQALYLRIGAGKDGLQRLNALSSSSEGIDTLAQKHLAAFQNLLTHYAKAQTAYLPRLNVFKEGESADYDHLSRFLEWQMAASLGEG